MQKSVYSLVLMDDVVAEIDRLAYAEGVSRSNLVNRILAEYASLTTPQSRSKDIFDHLQQALNLADGVFKLQNGSDAQLLVRSAVRYKYNPSVRYSIELFPY
ncbi:MAG: ribbon-helix-helix domain-containing protein, partial [Oscillospiraceae bacterium]|nr:ribbon-helix-helix domain-containing protein [Oscillospiraceae bacterium]